MQASFIVTARNKEKHVRRCVESVLAQSYPCEILLSDQGSTDDTRSILHQIAGAYSGPHKVRLLDCPLLDHKGMIGMNQHINWLMGQTDAEIIIHTSADDLTHVDRALWTVRAFEQYKPSMVLTGMYFSDENLIIGGVNKHPTESGWVTPSNCVNDAVAGSTSLAWSREFFDKVGPIPGVPSCDVYLPFLATLDKGAYYVNEKLHTYVCYADEANTGLEGVHRAVKDKDEGQRLQVEELMLFQITTGYYSILARMAERGWLTEEASGVLYERILARAASWCEVRQKMAIGRIAPIAFPT